MKELIMVTDWEKVEANDFYLSEEWEENSIEQMLLAKRLQKEGKLYVGYIVSAVDYAIYKQMDASQIFIDEDGERVLECESAIIGNNHEHREVFNY